jgi:hypothetical protein
MNTDFDDSSNCLPGKEQYQFFKYDSGGAFQYEYRAIDGELFTTVRNSLHACRAEKDIWLQNKAHNISNT